MAHITSADTKCCDNEIDFVEIDGFITCAKCGTVQDISTIPVQTNISSHSITDKVDEEIEEICDRAGIVGLTKSKAYNMFNCWTRKYPRFHKTTLRACAIYIACKQTHVPRTMKEISAFTGVCTKQLGRYERLVAEEHVSVNPEHYINRFCSKLQLN